MKGKKKKALSLQERIAMAKKAGLVQKPPPREIQPILESVEDDDDDWDDDEPVHMELPEYLKGRKTTVIQAPKGMLKVSDALFHMLEPFTVYMHKEEDFKKLAAMAMIAWNCAVSTPKDAKKLLEKLISTVPTEEEQRDLADVLRNLMERKLEFYPDDMRLIYSVEAQLTRKGPHLNVMSELR